MSDTYIDCSYRAMSPGYARLPRLRLSVHSCLVNTTLLRAIIPRLVASDVRLALIKHAHHAFDVDKPGKDSYELRKAGAGQVLVTSARRRALIMEKSPEADPDLNTELLYLDQEAVDLILVEGFKHERFPKIELRRAENGQPPLAPADESVIALASDAAASDSGNLPWLDINQPDAIVRFILGKVLGRD
jgi:molybdopterin-guanine dinucleotide biosynthesis protein MobB